MQNSGESKRLVKSFSDASRKVAKVGNQFLIPHKFTDDGDVVTGENFSAKHDISRLNLKDLQFLELWRDNKWNDEAVLKACSLAPDQAVKTLKKLAYFKTEDARIKALASQATPERVLAKDMENLESHTLQDTDHKSLDRIAKITGAFKTSEGGMTTVNVLNLNMTPEEEKKTREFFDTIATQAMGDPG